MAMTRITTNMIMRNYQNNLTSTLGGLESARKQVETGRRFSKSYEDPTAAAKAAILERRYMRNQDYQSSLTNVQKWQDSQEDVVTALNDMAITIEKEYSIGALNDPVGEAGRSAYAQALEELQNSMVSTLNARFGDTFVLAGNDGKNVPFTLKEIDGVMTLHYRNQPVSGPSADPDVLKELAGETTFVDLGFGMEIQGDTVTPSSAFNTALPGIKLVGYKGDGNGTTADMVTMVGKMAKALKEPTFDADEYKKMMAEFSDHRERLEDQFSVLGTKTQLLNATKDRLESEELAITQQFDDAVNINPAEAIMNYSWANYAYNSALKVGTSIITPSLLDFMK